MTRTEELLKLAKAATKVPHYNYRWGVDRFGEKGAGVKSFNADICSFVPTAIAEHVAAANPETIKQLVELVRLQHAAMNSPSGRKYTEAIEAFNKWEAGK
jgi:hypothetical protein